MSYHTTHDTYIKTALFNGAASRAMLQSMGMSQAGCAYRGTTTCHACPFEPVQECDYVCSRCQVRGMCKCGHDQTARLVAWGLVE